MSSMVQANCLIILSTLRIRFLRLAKICLSVFSIFVGAGFVSAENTVPFVLPSKKELSKIRSATVLTNKGPIFIELYPDLAPWHVANFKYLADKGFYRNTKFHIFHENYILQGGDPTGTGKGGPGYTLPPEFNKLQHDLGVLGMARLSGTNNPERRSNGSQFHILLNRAPRMDGNYTIFGKVMKGFDTLQLLRKGDVIQELVVYVRAES